MRCKKCGSQQVFYWHFYNRYGRDGAIMCKSCGAVFKAVRGKNRMLMGEFVEIHPKYRDRAE